MDLPWVTRLITEQLKVQTPPSRSTSTSQSTPSLHSTLLNLGESLKMSDQALIQLIQKVKPELLEQLTPQISHLLKQGSSTQDSLSIQAQVERQVDRLIQSIINSFQSIDNKSNLAQSQVQSQIQQIIQQWSSTLTPETLLKQAEVDNDLNTLNNLGRLNKLDTANTVNVVNIVNTLRPLVEFTLNTQPKQPNLSIPPVLKELIGLLEHNQLNQIAQLKTSEGIPSSTFVPNNTPALSTNLPTALPTNLPPTLEILRAEIQSWAQNFNTSEKLSANITEILKQNLGALEIPQASNSIQTIQFPLPPNPGAAISQEQLNSSNPQMASTQGPDLSSWLLPLIQNLSNTSSTASSSISSISSISTYPTQMNTTLAIPAMSLLSLSTEESTIHTAAQIPPTPRSLSDLQFLQETIQQTTDKSGVKPQVSPIQLTEVFKHFHPALYQLESTFKPGETPSLEDKQILLTQLLPIVQNKTNSNTLSAPQFTQFLLNNLNLNEWIKEPQTLLPKLSELPQPVQEAIQSALQEKPLLSPKELAQLIENIIRDHPSTKDNPTLTKLNHFNLWSQVEPEVKTENSREHHVYWSNGQELIHSKIQVHDERKDKSPGQEKNQAKQLLIHTTAPTLGEVSASLKQTQGDESSVNVQIEDETGKFGQSFENELEQFKLDLQQVGFELAQFSYRAKQAPATFITSKPKVSSSEIDLQA